MHLNPLMVKYEGVGTARFCSTVCSDPYKNNYAKKGKDFVTFPSDKVSNE